MKKQHYETPTTETLVVRFEGALCGSPYNAAGLKNFSTSGGDVEDQSDDDGGWTF